MVLTQVTEETKMKIEKNETLGKEKNRKFISVFSTSLKYPYYAEY